MSTSRSLLCFISSSRWYDTPVVARNSTNTCLLHRFHTYRQPDSTYLHQVAILFHLARWPIVGWSPQALGQGISRQPIGLRLHRWRGGPLTKRSKRLAAVGPGLDWPENVWMGAIVESGRYVFRIDHLRTVPAEVRFISAEPLLGPLPDLDMSGIHWLIAGGESGPERDP